MNKSILEMRGISKSFPGVIALDNVDFEIYPGGITALAGENGAGKSTLMKILGGVYQPDSGTIRINGTDGHVNSVSDAIDKGIGFIHQELNLLDNLNIAENIFLGREPVWGGALKLVDRKTLHAQTEIYLNRLGMNVSTYTPASTLSIAQQQTVEIAKALSLNARILIMDEPTSSLTLSETEKLMAIIKQLKSQGVAIVYISHRLSEIEEIADNVIVLRDGRNAGELSRYEISHDAIVKLMVGRELTHQYISSNAVKEPAYFSVHNLCTSKYPKRLVSFDVAAGEILGFAGLVGAGRSEVAQAIFGVDPILEGSISLDDKQIHIKSAKDAVSNGIYLIPEDRRQHGLILDMSLRENITIANLEQYSTSTFLINRDAEKLSSRNLFDKLSIKTPSTEALARNLSGGNQQKIVLAKWLVLKPKVMIFDEPTRGIDVGAKAEIYNIMRDLARNGVAIIMISSDMEEILCVSDRVAVMREGSITGILNREDCNEESIMRLAVK